MRVEFPSVEENGVFEKHSLREVEKIQLTAFIAAAGSMESEEITRPRSEHLVHFS